MHIYISTYIIHLHMGHRPEIAIYIYNKFLQFLIKKINFKKIKEYNCFSILTEFTCFQN